jgi:hypothetical protein
MLPSLLCALRRRPWGLWLALLLAVFGALAPAVSQALAMTRSGAPMMAICTSSEPRQATDTPGEQESAPALVHCPFCLLLADHVAPTPPFAAHFLALPVLSEKPAARFVFVFFPRFALTPPPRGPPAYA